MQDNWVMPKQRLNPCDTLSISVTIIMFSSETTLSHIWSHNYSVSNAWCVHYSWAIHSVSHQTPTLHWAWLWWLYSFYVCINLWRVAVDTVRWLIVSFIIASPLPQFEKSPQIPKTCDDYFVYFYNRIYINLENYFELEISGGWQVCVRVEYNLFMHTY